MVSVGHHPFTMLSRHMSEEHDQYGSIYPDPPQGAFSAAPSQPVFSAAAAIDMGLTSDAYYPRIGHDLPTTMGGFEHIPFVSEGPAGWSYVAGMSPPPMFHEDREMGVPSNISTASAPSAPSSAVGSPRSTHGQPAPMPDWASQGIVSPAIVGTHECYSGTEYSFAPTGMEDLAPFAYADTSKPPGFVGELPQTPPAPAPEQHQQLAGSASPCVSRRESSCTFSESGPATDTAYAQTVSSPMSPESSRRPSVLASPDSSNSLSSPMAPSWMSPVSQVSPFFSQSSGHFIAPLGSSCWFPCLFLTPCGCYMMLT